ncbi:riboflavin synthase [Kurthia sibirica]|uniref:Riboflavin synthase n=1 Tax=Kurthia sibirica TaxID=202750 RepID=A0A2U3ANB8_9BACL|nr:riboflavin synthase [Kurthia sibirica]PWI26034.1 riboflavin synthase [Kurthia sibirica]GEK34565.1 riboflavin synthase [Kurthia sibirica]
MFTGIIEEVGQLQNMRKIGEKMRVVISAQHILSDLKLGDSVAVNGVCLTASKITIKYFEADIMPETYRHTTFKHLTVQQPVNLERAMQLNDRFGGHIVSGHVDDIGKIIKIKKDAQQILLTIRVTSNIAQQLIVKGSITIDGISLTIFYVTTTTCTVSIIPHTFAQTILHAKKMGDEVNIEVDYVSKSIRQKSVVIDEEFLRKNGF